MILISFRAQIHSCLIISQRVSDAGYMYYYVRLHINLHFICCVESRRSTNELACAPGLPLYEMQPQIQIPLIGSHSHTVNHRKKKKKKKITKKGVKT